MINVRSRISNHLPEEVILEFLKDVSIDYTNRPTSIYSSVDSRIRQVYITIANSTYELTNP